jgi:hypothetical protein
MPLDLVPSVPESLDLERLVCINGGGTSGVLVCSPTVICGQHVCGEAVPAIPPILTPLPACEGLDLQPVECA